MATKMSQVSTEDLINSIYDAENKLQKASATTSSITKQNARSQSTLRQIQRKRKPASLLQRLLAVDHPSGYQCHVPSLHGSQGTPTGVAALLLHEEDWNVLERLPVRVGHN